MNIFKDDRSEETAVIKAADIGSGKSKPSVMSKLKNYKAQAEDEKLCFRLLKEYLDILQDWKKRFEPKTQDTEPDHRFTEADRMYDCTKYMLDLLIVSSSEERTELVRNMMQDNKITLLQEHLKEIKAKSS